MSCPTPYSPDEVRHDIRNTTRGEYLFVPREEICAAFQFILASAIRRYRVGVVAYAVMATHIHLLLVDLGAPGEPSDVPGFRQFVRSTFAQFIKSYWDLDAGCVFCPDSIGKSIKVLDFESVEDAIAYIETNPIDAGMEKHPNRMGGAVSQREWLLEPITIRRPSRFFQARTWEEEETLQLVVPPCAEELGHTAESFYQHSKLAMETKLAKTLKERKKLGLKSRPLHVLKRYSPRNKKPSGRSAGDHREILLACKDPVRSAKEFARVRAFRRAHARAMERLREGHKDVVFPAGTYLAAKRYGVPVALPSGRDRPDTDD